jgi:hypothetical protein
VSNTVYEQHAKHLIDTLGATEARRVTIQRRDQNSPGTFTYAFNQAVLKQLERMARETV